MNSSRRRAIANPEATYKVRLADGTMAAFPSFARALAVSHAIIGGPIAKSCRDTQPGYILIP
jgi:hypothetical protein